MALFHFGTHGPHGSTVVFLELGDERFPYQELSKSVLVWHATCIRRGQNPGGRQEREAAELEEAFSF